MDRALCHPSKPTDFFATQILGGNVTSRNQGLSSNDQGRQRRETLGTRLRFRECFVFPKSRINENGGNLHETIMRRRPVVNLSQATKSCRINRPKKSTRVYKQRSRVEIYKQRSLL